MLQNQKNVRVTCLCMYLKVSVGDLSGVPEKQLKRVARIFMPAPNAMQSGTDNIHQWHLEFNTQERWENPLMGWTSRYRINTI